MLLPLLHKCMFLQMHLGLGLAFLMFASATPFIPFSGSTIAYVNPDPCPCPISQRKA